MSSVEKEINDLIDYCYTRAEVGDGGMTTHDVWMEVGERLSALLNTVKREEQPKIGWASESSMLDGM